MEEIELDQSVGIGASFSEPWKVEVEINVNDMDVDDIFATLTEVGEIFFFVIN